jgi:hypothetical protein
MFIFISVITIFVYYFAFIVYLEMANPVFF